MEQSGTITQIGTKNQVSEKFAKREFVITFQDGNYQKHLALQFVNDKCDILDKYLVGQSVNVSFNLESRAWQDKWFTTASAWKISPIEAVSTTAQQQAQPVDDGSGLPF